MQCKCHLPSPIPSFTEESNQMNKKLRKPTHRMQICRPFRLPAIHENNNDDDMQYAICQPAE
jgi:hypothetical protein